ncbi:sarcosine oxidase subunit gamma [Amorphus orientalis]|uniref:Sarcosine oxidase subunit gamma n=1 Tax=Amorphus orientalis TaxID=649198 RepID=A0AAE4AWE4_9HYPH|nr:sarcosine oxidase subunit gamma family protein [Amorphus orientalis]MDQ0317684.1 sarcosine oxidase subunit gamma [Amorphus orientalis]
MAEMEDVFRGRLSPGRQGGRSTATPIRIAAIAGVSAAQIQAWPGKREGVAAALSGCGIALPTERDLTCDGGRICGRIAPGRFLVLSDRPVADVTEAVASDIGAVADLSHARAGVRIAGDRVEDLLAKAAAIPFDATGFPPGTLAQTSIHHMGCLIVRRTEDTFDLYVLTSFAVSFADWLTDAAREFGWATGPAVSLALKAEPVHG